MSEGRTEYLQLVLDVGLTIDPVVIWQRILDVVRMRPALPEETYRDIGEFLRQTPWVREKLPGIQQLAEEAEREGRLRGEEAGRKLGEEAGRRLGEEVGEKRGERRGERRGRIHAEQQTLLRQMRRKFGDVPESIVLRIESTQDLLQLGAWLDRVVDAKTLEDMGLADKVNAGTP